jgi:hypothetical protein
MNLAKRLIIVGSALIAVSAFLQVAVPALGYPLWNRAADQSFLLIVEYARWFVSDTLPPLGASLLTAGIVIYYLEKKSAAPTD